MLGETHSVLYLVQGQGCEVGHHLRMGLGHREACLSDSATAQREPS